MWSHHCKFYLRKVYPGICCGRTSLRTLRSWGLIRDLIIYRRKGNVISSESAKNEEYASTSLQVRLPLFYGNYLIYMGCRFACVLGRLPLWLSPRLRVIDYSVGYGMREPLVPVHSLIDQIRLMVRHSGKVNFASNRKRAEDTKMYFVHLILV